MSLHPDRRSALRAASSSKAVLAKAVFAKAVSATAVFPAAVLAAGLLGACTNSKGADSPAIDLGAPGTTWAAKNLEQRFGFMAAQVHPTMARLFIDYDPDKVGFDCSNCHGSNMEQIDYEMPNKALYALPKERPYDDAIDFDAKIAVFMMTKVTPALQELFNKGEGPPTKASCFSCHPVAE